MYYKNDNNHIESNLNQDRHKKNEKCCNENYKEKSKEDSKKSCDDDFKMMPYNEQCEMMPYNKPCQMMPCYCCHPIMPLCPMIMDNKSPMMMDNQIPMMNPNMMKPDMMITPMIKPSTPMCNENMMPITKNPCDKCRSEDNIEDDNLYRAPYHNMNMHNQYNPNHNNYYHHPYYNNYYHPYYHNHMDIPWWIYFL